MKKFKLMRMIVIILSLVSLFVLNPIGTNAQWKKDSKGWWNEGDSKRLSIGWKQISGEWYYFYSDGYMAHDTTIDGYYLGSDGARETEENKVNSTTLTKNDFSVISSDGENNNIIGFLADSTWGNVCIYEGRDEPKKDKIIINQFKNNYLYLGEEEDKNFKTYRNISLGDQLNNVLNVYGSTPIKNINEHDIFYRYPNSEKNEVSKYLIYTHFEGIEQYTINFYFNTSDQLVLMAYVKNEKMNDTNVYKSFESGFTILIKTGMIVNYSGTDTEVVIPSKVNDVLVTSIGFEPFYGRSDLTRITIPDNITSIAKNAFINCNKALFHVKSERVKQLLINSGVDVNKIILND